MKNSNLIRQLVILGGNIYKQDFPIINIINGAKKYKLNIFIITDKDRLNYPNKNFTSFKNFLNSKNIKFRSFKSYLKMSNFLLNKFNSKNTLILSANCKWLLKKNIINNYKFLFNYHNADLPSQRGAACHSWGIMMNKKDSSLNMHLISEKFDTGKIIYNQKYKLNNYLSNLNSIYRKINKEEKFFFNKFFEKFFQKKLYTKSQNDNKSFYWPKLDQKKNSHVNWYWTSKEIYRFCNAFDNPFKGITTKYKRSKILLTSAKLADVNINFHPFQYGMIYRKNNKRVFIATGDGGISFKLKNYKLDKVKLGFKFYN